MREALQEAVIKAETLGRAHARTLSTVIIESEPENANELMIVVGSYMGALDRELKVQAEV